MTMTMTDDREGFEQTAIRRQYNENKNAVCTFTNSRLTSEVKSLVGQQASYHTKFIYKNGKA